MLWQRRDDYQGKLLYSQSLLVCLLISLSDDGDDVMTAVDMLVGLEELMVVDV